MAMRIKTICLKVKMPILNQTILIEQISIEEDDDLKNEKLRSKNSTRHQSQRTKTRRKLKNIKRLISGPNTTTTELQHRLVLSMLLLLKKF